VDDKKNIMKFSKTYILNTIGQALKQGTTPRKLALTCALGAVVGIFPIMGTTTFLCFVLSVWLRLNLPIIQLVNYLVVGLQVLLIIPFMNAGIYLFNLPDFNYSKKQLIDLFQNNFWGLLKNSGATLAGGVGAWLFVAIPLFCLLFYSLLFLFSWLKRKELREVKPA
jgi:uncharacterized protein (DUF2062 family)